MIVGASLAGIKTAQGLRRGGLTDEIAVVDGHHRLAVDRPQLSKTYLATSDAAARDLVTDEQAAALDLKLLLGRRATALDLAARELDLDDGQRLGFDRLVIACGSHPRRLPALEGLARVHVLRTEVDADALRTDLSDAERLVVIGGGFIGAEVAWTARQRGVDVTIVEQLDSLMLRGLGPELGALMTQRHRAEGIDVRLGVGVDAVDGRQRVESVRLSDGTSVDADVVVIGVGTIPTTEWLEGSGLLLDDGVVCDDTLAAVGVDGVWAAGDIARWQHPRLGSIRVEHWTNAVEQAAVVAGSMLGTAKPYDALPYVWSDQLGGRLQIVGRVVPGDRTELVVGSPETGSSEPFVAVAGDDTTLHAVIGFGAVKELMAYRKLLVDGAGWAEVRERAASG